MVKAASAPCLLGPGWGLWGRTTPSGRRGFGRPILKTPGSFSGVAVGRRVHAGSVRVGFRLPHDDLRSQKRDLYSLGFGRRRIARFFGPELISELVFANRVREHTTGPAAEPPH